MGGMQYLNTIVQNNPFLLAIFLLWSITWKGLALWKAAKRNSKFWFIIILILNTVGLLEIAYIFFLHKLDMPPLLGKLKKGKIN